MTAASPLPRAGRPEPDRWTRVFAGELRQVPEARAFVSRALAGCPARETLMACVSELAANAVTHTASGRGGHFTVEVTRPSSGVARVAVTDAGSPSEPAILPPDALASDVLASDVLAEGGRGLALVAALAGDWGYHPAPGPGRTVWAQATWPIAVAITSTGTAITRAASPLRQPAASPRQARPGSFPTDPAGPPR
jgi:serine/threonine-protein kinase RsbW